MAKVLTASGDTGRLPPGLALGGRSSGK